MAGCLFATAAWAGDRDISMREGERRSFKLPGVSQIAIDDASVVEGVAKNDQLSVTARGAGTARILVLLKNDQWVTFKVKVAASDVAEGPVPEALPADGEPVRLRAGESRVFETPGILKMPVSGQGFEAKVNGKLLELRGVSPGRTVVDLGLSGGKKVQLTVLVEGEKRGLGSAAKKVEQAAGERIELPVSAEILIKAPEVDGVQVEDDEVAEVRIVGDGRVVVRGLQEGETVVFVRRGGRVYAHPVLVVMP
ncbi:MAG: pilus assembly protein N-terminal domain-containing protein [Archangiaceae bacterium]|nr:pilus assembly protein N-terminal domain-containing protein [Archangiaceae bacterium]